MATLYTTKTAALRAITIDSSIIDTKKLLIKTPEDTNSSRTDIIEYINNVASKSDSSVVDSYTNGTNWYRKYSDGWIEQGGLVGTGSSSYTLTFNIAFSNTNYTFIAQDTVTTTTNTDTNGWENHAGVSDYTATSVRLNKQSGREVSWYACGY